MAQLISHIKNQKIKKILIVTHENADPDALCGLYSLKSILKRIFTELEILISADGLSSLSEQIASKLNITISTNVETFHPDLIILFDVNNLHKTGSIANYINVDSKAIVIIDHHTPPPEINDFSPLSIVDDNAISATEIIFYEFDQMGIQFTPEEAFAILLGMIYDSKHFILGNLRSFSIVSKLIEIGANYNQAKSLLKIPMIKPEKIARIKAAQRLKIRKIKDWIIVTSHVSSYEASACRALINLGADVAFVIAERKNQVRISARSTPEFYEKTKIHLGKDILEKIGNIIDGVGGGHSTAAGCDGKKNSEEANHQILKILESKISKLYNNQ